MDRVPLRDRVKLRLTAMGWLNRPEFSGIQVHDFRPGWDSIQTMCDEIVDREEFQRRLAQTTHTRRGGASLVQMTIDETQ